MTWHHLCQQFEEENLRQERGNKEEEAWGRRPKKRERSESNQGGQLCCSWQSYIEINLKLWENRYSS